MFSIINLFLLIFAFFCKNAFCGELSFATEGLFCQVGVHMLLRRFSKCSTSVKCYLFKTYCSNPYTVYTVYGMSYMYTVYVMSYMYYFIG